MDDWTFVSPLTTGGVYLPLDYLADPDAGLTRSTSQRISASGELKTTLYSSYVTLDPFHGVAKPQVATVELQMPDAAAPGGYDNHVQSISVNHYNAYGEVLYTLNTVAPDPANPGKWLATGTATTYSDGTGGTPFGLATATQAVTADVSADGTVTGYQAVSGNLTQTVYYATGDTAVGASAGKPKYSVDAAGQETFYAYDANGNAALTFTYKTWTDPTGASVSGWVGTFAVYDSAGRQTDAYSATYQDNGADAALAAHVLPVVGGGPAGIQVDTTPTDAGHVTVYQAPLRTQHVDYDTTGRKTDTIDVYGGVTTYTYDANGNVIDQVNPDGTEQRSVYDALNRVIWSTNSFDPANLSTAITTRTVYNQLGQTVETQDYAGQLVDLGTKTVGSNTLPSTSVATVDGTPNGLPTSGSLISTTTTFYDAAGRVIETIGANGLRTGTAYEPDGSVLYTGPLADSAPDGGHSVAEEGVATFAYTTADFAAGKDGSDATRLDYAEADPIAYDATLGLFYTRSVDEDGNATKSYTDGQGRSVRTVYADGSFTETLYSVGTTAVSVDQEGEIVSNPDGWTGITGGGYEVVNVAMRKGTDTPAYSYDLYNAAGQLTDVWLAKVVDNGPNATTGQTKGNPHWHYTYDTAGNETGQVSGNGNAAGASPALFTTSWAYDQNGSKVRQILPDGELQTWAYDVYGNNTSHKDYSATDHTTALQTTLDTYDTSAAHGGRLVEEYRYASDQPVGSTVAPDEKTTYEYDDALPPAEQTDQGNVVEVQDWAVRSGSLQVIDSTHYTYDPISGNQATITTADGTIHYVYDEATGNLVEAWTGSGPSLAKSSAQHDVQYGYDAQGRLESVTQIKLNGAAPTTATAGTQYDASGHVIATAGPTTDYTYDNAGNLLSDAEPNGDTTAYTYNDLNQLTLEVITNGNTDEPLFREETTWQHDGQKSGVTDTRYNASGGATSQITYAWTYDSDNRLTDEVLTVQSGSGSDLPDAYADHYEFDLDNNRVLKTIGGGADATGGTTIVYVYNGDDQLLTATGTGTGNYTTQSSYDADGNLISQAHTGDGAVASTYGYDLRNQMTSATVAGVTTAYTYDHNGVLTSETTAGSTTYDLNDPNNPTGYSKAIQQTCTLAGSPTTSYVLGLHIEAQSNVTKGTLYLLVDGHGSARALADTSGAVVSGQTFDYDAFGMTLINAGTAETEWLFGGDGVYDHATGWTYQLARWRDEFKFTQPDTYDGDAGDPISLSKYTYVGDNPVRSFDPTGHILSAVSSLEGDIANYEGVASGYANAGSSTDDSQYDNMFSVGYSAGRSELAASFAGSGTATAGILGNALTSIGNGLVSVGRNIDGGYAFFGAGGRYKYLGGEIGIGGFWGKGGAGAGIEGYGWVGAPKGKKGGFVGGGFWWTPPKSFGLGLVAGFDFGVFGIEAYYDAVNDETYIGLSGGGAILQGGAGISISGHFF